MLTTLFSLLIVVLVLGLVWWLIGQLPIAPPVRTVVTVIFVAIAVFILLSFLPGAPIHLHGG
jgi:hypothetical protein